MSKRLKFFLGHFAISAIIAIISIYLVFMVWYPAPLAKALGVTHLFLMLILIDVIIGPLFGWFVYKENKKSLKMDLTVVILIQIFAFSYGFYTIAQGRPAWILYDAFTFHVIRNSDVETSNLQRAKPEFQSASWLKPQFVALNVPAKGGGIDRLPPGTIALDHPMYYTDILNARSQIQSVALPMSFLQNFNSKQQVNTIIQQYPEADAWMGLSAPAQDMVVLINKEKGEVVKIVDLHPWK
ncbi:TfpX/TfpZ family type IV pilin accessory protein [Acinetobacter gyllenbergii]|uniref:TfpX/TfpZ family type IV pilin accessory protein n=1 Tax=Acinetobacter gyllenbergii TaxID=134534 RepID=UPI003AF6E12C